MTDRSYTGLRAALDAGPKGGKWTWKQVGSFSTPGCAVFWPDTSKGGTHYRRLDSGGGMEQADAEFIADANPETIRALLADYDRLRDALTAIEQWEAPLVESRGKVVSMSVAYGSNGVRDYFRGVARAALAQEQGESE